MSQKYAGGCDHVHTHSNAEPIDIHTCHCSVCKRVTGQDSTHVVLFNHGDLDVENLDGLNRQPFNDQNTDAGPQLHGHRRTGPRVLISSLLTAMLRASICTKNWAIRK